MANFFIFKMGTVMPTWWIMIMCVQYPAQHLSWGEYSTMVGIIKSATSASWILTVFGSLYK